MLAPRPGTWGAVPTIAAMLADGLRGLGWSVDIRGWGKHSESESFAAKVVGRPADASRMASELRRDRPDAVIVHSGLDWFSVPRDLSLQTFAGAGRPATLLMPHGGRSERLDPGSGDRAFRTAARALLDRCDGVLVLSEAEASAFRAFAPAIPVWRVDNPFEPTLRASLGVEPQAAPDPAEVLFVGRVVRAKGVFELVEAAAGPGDEASGPASWRLVIVGEGPDSAELGARIAELGLAASVVRTGWLSDVELARRYSAASVLVLPSHREGFPTVIPEAMSFGLPIVTTAVGGIPDRLADGVNASFVPVEDAPRLRGSLDALLASREARMRMGEANLALAGTWAPTAVAREYDAILKEVVGGRVA
jgi:glycosyltransferase involved in cell wall biosynthesis